MPTFDPRAWNILGAAGALALAACGPGSIDGDGEASADENDEYLLDSDGYDDYAEWYDDAYDDGYDDDWYEDPCDACAPDQLCNEEFGCYYLPCEEQEDCEELGGSICIDQECHELGANEFCGEWPTQAVELPAGDLVLALSFVDIDGDGAQELVDVGPSGIRVLDSDGSVTETAWVQPASFSSVIGALVDGDDRLDLVFTDPGQARVRVLLGTGTGAFTGESDAPLGAAGLTDPVAIDIDGDGQDELLALQEGSLVEVTQLGEGAAVSPVPVMLNIFEHLYSAEFDVDSDLDLLAAGLVDDPAKAQAQAIYQDNGWTADPQLVLGVSGESPDALVWGAFDLDGDGRDHALSVAGGGVALVYTQTTGSSLAYYLDGSAGSVLWVVGAELDGSAGEELVIGGAAPVLVGANSEEPLGCTHILPELPPFTDAAAVGDFDGDGIDELAFEVAGQARLFMSGD